MGALRGIKQPHVSALMRNRMTNSSLKNSVCGLLKKTQRRGRALFVIVSVKRDR